MIIKTMTVDRMSTKLLNVNEPDRCVKPDADRCVRIIGAAFGDPMSEKTFSGVSKHLFNALSRRQVLAGCINTRQIKVIEMFNGALKLSKMFKCSRPCVNSRWLWKGSTVDKMTERFKQRLCACEGIDAVLQIGTHVRVESSNVRHYCLTDMTIAQAARASQFTALYLDDRQVAEAIEKQKQIFESCEMIFTDSNWARRSVIEDYGMSAEKVSVCGVGTSMVPCFNRAASDRYNILFVGRDWKRKGGSILMKAFKQTKRHIKEATLTIIGCEPDISDPDVNVLGYLNKEVASDYRTIMNAFGQASVFCVPSMFEPFGICFLEAQLCGIPVITFDGEGRIDAIEDGVGGVLVKEKTASALSDALIRLLINKPLALEMGAAGHDYVMNNYTWDHVAERILNKIEERVSV